MSSRIAVLGAVSGLLLLGQGTAVLCAQTPVPPVPPVQSAPAATSASAAPKPEGSGLLVRVEVVFLRLEGEKKIGSLPYTLYAVPGNNSSLRFGQSVPVVQGAGSVSYQSVGTNIDVTGFRVRGDSRYELTLVASSSFLYPVPTSAGSTPLTAGQPVIGTYTINTPIIARDGQTIGFSIATDKITGETMRAEVTLTAIK